MRCDAHSVAPRQPHDPQQPRFFVDVCALGDSRPRFHSPPPPTPPGLVVSLSVYFPREGDEWAGCLLIRAAPFAGDSLSLVSSAPLGLAVPPECMWGCVF